LISDRAKQGYIVNVTDIVKILIFYAYSRRENSTMYKILYGNEGGMKKLVATGQVWICGYGRKMYSFVAATTRLLFW